MSTGTKSYGNVFPSTTQTSKFFILPTEICHEIYFLAFDIPRSPITLGINLDVPSTQREQDGSRELIRFEYIVESASGVEFHQVKGSQFKQFRICRQIYMEVMDLYFERGTWEIGNASFVFGKLLQIPMSIQSQIRSLKMWIVSNYIVWGERGRGGHTACSIEQLDGIAQRFRSLHQLRVLHLSIDLAAFPKPDQLPRDLFVVENGQLHYHFSAVEAISLFVWEGLETRIWLAEAELRDLNAEGLWTDLGYCFGPPNIQWVPLSKDEHLGVLGDIVITGK